MYSQLLFLALFLSSASASCLHGTSHMPRRLNKRATGVKVSDFGYHGDTGPFSWANLAAENSACSNGSNQSPINLDSSIPYSQDTPIIDFPNVESAEVENLGTTIETIVNGTTIIGGTTFHLAQYHIHTPSEHRICNEYYPLEMHMVHETDEGSLAVLVILFQLSEDGSTTQLLTGTTAHLDEIVTPGTGTESGALDFTPIVEHFTTTPLFTYSGSLTTPPCTESITFYVAQSPLPINVATFNALKSVIKFNSRFIQNTLGQPNLLSESGKSDSSE